MGNRNANKQEVVQQITTFQTKSMITTKKSPIEDDYQILQMIGSGSFSQVFKSKSKKTGNIRAIKKIARRKKSTLQSLLLNEFEVLRQMDHPNILKMYQMYQTYNYLYIVSELCIGKELYQVIAKRKIFSQKQACKIFQQICLAVRYIHTKKVMHRDIKPENIIYDQQTQSLKLVDFGSCLRFQSSKPQQRRRIGTSYYVAPQVLNRHYNQKCDVWSLGVILYIMLSSQAPFKGKTDIDILKSVQNGKLQFEKKSVWSLKSQSVKDLISNMICRNLNDRFDMNGVLDHRWFKQVGQKDNLNENEQIKISQYLKNMKQFKINSNRIEDGVLIFIVNFISNNQDQAAMMKCFKALDLNGDGVLSLEQVQKGMSLYLRVSQNEALTIAQSIFKKVDLNNSGFIDYSQFVMSTQSIQVTISEQNLDLAFNYIDRDGNGSLSVTQLRSKLGQNISKQTYKKLLRQFDKDNDGQINRVQFKAMMKSLIRRSQTI